MKRYWILPAAWMVSACYTYVPTTDPAPLDSKVEVLLSPEGRRSLAGRVGINPMVLRGTVIETEPERVMLAVRSTTPFEGVGGDPLYQHIDIPRADILLVRTRMISATRSILLGAGIVAAATAVLVTQLDNGGPASPGAPGGNPPPELVQPWVYIPIP